MTVTDFLHVNIRCADVERTRVFYEQLIGLTVGDRPPFESVGYWLYVGGMPLVHLVQRGASDRLHEGSGNTTRAALHHAGLSFREAVVPRDRTIQIFVRDPDGIRVELSFDAAAKQ